jgi:membrane associated rhomboid family serine protease
MRNNHLLVFQWTKKSGGVVMCLRMPQEPLNRRPDGIEPGRSTDVYEAGVAPRASGPPVAQTLRAPVPFVTYSLIAACTAVAVYYNGTDNGAHLDQLAFSPSHAQLWPGILTHLFAHSGLLHLAGNMWMAFIFGRIVEWRYGAWRFLLIYFISGIFAAMAQAVFVPEALLIGASGAIAGVMAVFLRHYPRSNLYLMGVVPIPTWLFMLFFVLSNSAGVVLNTGEPVGYVAHLGGFLAGLIVSLAMVPPGSAASRNQRSWFEVY